MPSKHPAIVESQEKRVEATPLRRILPLILTGILLVMLAFIVDVLAVFRRLVTISSEFLGIAMAAMAVNVLFSSLRYQQVLEKLAARRLPLRQLLNINLLTLFSAHLLPIAAAADGLRVAATSHQFQLPFGTSLEAVVHDRILAVAGLFLCLFLVVPLQVRLGVEEELLLSQLAIAIAFLLGGAVLVWIRARPTQASGRFSSTSRRLVGRLISHYADSRSLFIQCALALAGTAAFAAMISFLAHGLSIELPLLAAIAFAPTIYLSQAVPFFYVGFGAREIVSVALLSESGTMELESAVAISVSIGLCNFLIGLPGALSAANYLSYIGTFRRKSETWE